MKTKFRTKKPMENFEVKDLYRGEYIIVRMRKEEGGEAIELKAELKNITDFALKSLANEIVEEMKRRNIFN
jgi:hypothetical protein